MKPERRELIQKVYIRICRDSRFRFTPVDAAHLTGKICDGDALEVWCALGMENMERIASGEHPAVNNPHYIGASS